MLALQTVCCPNFYFFFLSSKCIIRVGIDMQHQNLCNGCFHESSLTNCKKEFKKAEHLFKEWLEWLKLSKNIHKLASLRKHKVQYSVYA